MTDKAVRIATVEAVRTAFNTTKDSMNAAGTAIAAENSAELNPLTVEFNKVATQLNASRPAIIAAIDAAYALPGVPDVPTGITARFT